MCRSIYSFKVRAKITFNTDYGIFFLLLLLHKNNTSKRGQISREGMKTLTWFRVQDVRLSWSCSWWGGSELSGSSAGYMEETKQQLCGRAPCGALGWICGFCVAEAVGVHRTALWEGAEQTRITSQLILANKSTEHDKNQETNLYRSGSTGLRRRSVPPRTHRVSLPPGRGWAGSSPPRSGPMPLSPAGSPDLHRSRCWGRSSGPYLRGHRTCTEKRGNYANS